MNCILKQCPHFKSKNCESLGECGCGYALNKARDPGGYKVIIAFNPTVRALREARLVSVRPITGTAHAVVRAL